MQFVAKRRWKDEQAGRDEKERSCFHGFWKVICAEVIHNPQADSEMRRTQAHDELVFAAWAPFPVTWTKPLIMLNCALWLWRGRFIFVSRIQGVEDRNEDYFPYGLTYNPMGGSAIVHELLGYLGISSLAEAQLSDEPYGFRRDGPWKKLFVQVGDLLWLSYGTDARLDIQSRADSFPAIDKSVATATYSRHLICGMGLIGLGPANAAIGDEVYLLTGGNAVRVTSLRKQK
jgi:hypothetical protein